MTLPLKHPTPEIAKFIIEVKEGISEIQRQFGERVVPELSLSMDDLLTSLQSESLDKHVRTNNLLILSKLIAVTPDFDQVLLERVGKCLIQTLRAGILQDLKILTRGTSSYFARSLGSNREETILGVLRSLSSLQIPQPVSIRECCLILLVFGKFLKATFQLLILHLGFFRSVADEALAVLAHIPNNAEWALSLDDEALKSSFQLSTQLFKFSFGQDLFKLFSGEPFTQFLTMLFGSAKKFPLTLRKLCELLLLFQRASEDTPANEMLLIENAHVWKAAHMTIISNILARFFLGDVIGFDPAHQSLFKSAAENLNCYILQLTPTKEMRIQLGTFAKFIFSRSYCISQNEYEVFRKKPIESFVINFFDRSEVFRRRTACMVICAIVDKIGFDTFASFFDLSLSELKDTNQAQWAREGLYFFLEQLINTLQFSEDFLQMDVLSHLPKVFNDAESQIPILRFRALSLLLALYTFQPVKNAAFSNAALFSALKGLQSNELHAQIVSALLLSKLASYDQCSATLASGFVHWFFSYTNVIENYAFKELIEPLAEMIERFSVPLREFSVEVAKILTRIDRHMMSSPFANPETEEMMDWEINRARLELTNIPLDQSKRGEFIEALYPFMVRSFGLGNRMIMNDLLISLIKLLSEHTTGRIDQHLWYFYEVFCNFFIFDLIDISRKNECLELIGLPQVAVCLKEMCPLLMEFIETFLAVCERSQTKGQYEDEFNRSEDELALIACYNLIYVGRHSADLVKVIMFTNSLILTMKGHNSLEQLSNCTLGTAMKLRSIGKGVDSFIEQNLKMSCLGVILHIDFELGLKVFQTSNITSIILEKWVHDHKIAAPWNVRISSFAGLISIFRNSSRCPELFSGKIKREVLADFLLKELIMLIEMKKFERDASEMNVFDLDSLSAMSKDRFTKASAQFSVNKLFKRFSSQIMYLSPGCIFTVHNIENLSFQKLLLDSFSANSSDISIQQCISELEADVQLELRENLQLSALKP